MSSVTVVGFMHSDATCNCSPRLPPRRLWNSEGGSAKRTAAPTSDASAGGCARAWHCGQPLSAVDLPDAFLAWPQVTAIYKNGNNYVIYTTLARAITPQPRMSVPQPSPTSLQTAPKPRPSWSCRREGQPPPFSLQPGRLRAPAVSAHLNEAARAFQA
jgi:hypothetical protein